jgi:hypothetical protein
MKNTILKAVFAVAITCSALASQAQSRPGFPNPPTLPGGSTHHNAPFDGGASLLIGAGIAYGLKKAHSLKKAI